MREELLVLCDLAYVSLVNVQTMAGVAIKEVVSFADAELFNNIKFKLNPRILSCEQSRNLIYFCL